MVRWRLKTGAPGRDGGKTAAPEECELEEDPFFYVRGPLEQMSARRSPPFQAGHRRTSRVLATSAHRKSLDQDFSVISFLEAWIPHSKTNEQVQKGPPLTDWAKRLGMLRYTMLIESRTLDDLSTPEEEVLQSNGGV